MKLFLQQGDGVSGYSTEQAAAHPFDSRYGVDTSGLIWGERLPLGKREGYWATGYYGIAPSVLWQALDRLRLEWPQHTFVDVGCGKGRALLLALRYPFRRVIGIELSPELVTIAKANLDRFQAEWRLPVPSDAIVADAAGYELPLEPLVLFLYHPFAAPVMKRFLVRLQSSLRENPRQLFLLYTNPELDGLLRNTPWLVKLWDECLPMSAEDTAADLFRSTYERIAAYRAVAVSSK